MKNRKLVSVLVAAAASLALIVGPALPASAATGSGAVACPSNMVARVTLTTSSNTYLKWYKYGNWSVQVGSTVSSISSQKRTVVFYAPRSGQIGFYIESGGVSNVVATCVF